MVNHPFVPQSLIGRQTELQQIAEIFLRDGDLLIAGVPGSGRRTLIRWAAQQVKARVLEIDCMRATDSQRFLQILAESLMAAFNSPQEQGIIQDWITQYPLNLEPGIHGRARLVWHLATEGEWSLFQTLLSLPQVMAEALDCRVVIVFQNFPHLRSWDRSGNWEAYLRQEIQRQSRVSYALIAMVAESWVQDSSLQVISLSPLRNQDLFPWFVKVMETEGLRFDPEGKALGLFLSYVQGHVGDAIALARRIWLDCRVLSSLKDLGKEGIIQSHHVHRSALALVEDLAQTFESLIFLLPPSQVRVLESLALDPTDSPHSKEYIQKHHLSRGGSLQGALASLEQKGLVYGSQYSYRITLPLLAFWLRYRLT
ncbi:MAG: ATP-binding protein [Leptolyngbyaceae bacterium]|nr:ATP-binding protein [Leptolyngbyaceae bacterium]